MKHIQVETTLNLNNVPNVDEVMPKEFATAQGWFDSGKLTALYLKEGSTGAVMFFKNVEKSEVAKLICTLPLYPYFDEIRYSIVDKGM